MPRRVVGFAFRKYIVILPFLSAFMAEVAILLLANMNKMYGNATSNIFYALTARLLWLYILAIIS